MDGRDGGIARLCHFCVTPMPSHDRRVWPGPWPAATGTAPTLAGVQRSVLQGLAAFRWAAWAWMAAVLVISRHDLRRPALAVVQGGLALGLTIMATALLRSDPDRLTQPGPV